MKRGNPYVREDDSWQCRLSHCLTHSDFTGRGQNNVSVGEEQTETLFWVPKVEPTEPDPSFVEGCLHQLENEITKRRNRKAYDQALDMSPSYVENEAFRLSMLRATDFNVKKAGIRTIRYFQSKLELFGLEKLVSDITLEDLEAGDLEVLRSGAYQFLPNKDASNRPILFGRYKDLKFHSRNVARVLWYKLHAIAEDEENQKSGLAVVKFDVGCVPMDRFYERDSVEIPHDVIRDKGIDRELIKWIRKACDYAPIRFDSIHFCFDDSRWRTLPELVFAVTSRLTGMRIVSHVGTQQECQYSLLCHGIQSNSIPVSKSGELLDASQLEWLATRRTTEYLRKSHEDVTRS